MKSKTYSIKQSVTAMATLCLVSEFSFGQVDCQDGLDYKKSCNPYDIEFVKIDKTSNSNTQKFSSNDKNHIHDNETVGYLDRLSEKYNLKTKGEYALIKSQNRKKPKESNKSIELDPKTLKQVASKTKNSTQNKESAYKKIEKIAKTNKAVSKSKKSLKSNQNKKVDKITKKVAQNSLSKEYIVKKGDSLIKIARKFNLDKDKLKKINSIIKNSRVKIGQKLKLPSNVSSVKKLAKKVDTKHEKKDFYIVKKGDSISKITKRMGLSIIKLREINKLSRSSQIKVGDKIYLKPTKFVKRKSRVFDFAKNIKYKKISISKFKNKIRVTATAYTSHSSQTDKTPFVAAWNNRIKPGMKIIAVSHDLIKKYGLKNGVKVKLKGLPGLFTVRDKMNKRFKNRIDIYMGMNKRKALKWGKKRITLYW